MLSVINLLFVCLIVIGNVLVYSISLLPVRTPFKPFSAANQIQSSSTSTCSFTPIDVSQPASLPWKESIQPHRSLSYMSMLESQLTLMKQHNIENVGTDERFSHITSSVKCARMSSMTFKNSIFRKIRVTYFDGGDSVQVLNSLWYPDYKYDIPMLGVDLISLGKSRVLSVIDLQPLHPTTDYSDKYIAPLNNIRKKYPDLHGTLSGKFYDDTSFFSKNMLFGRFTDESKLDSIVAPALNEYMEYYLNLSKTAIADETEEGMKAVYERQKAYDLYSSAKDPAVGLFDAYFGKEWSSSFVHDYLFEHSSNSGSNYEAPVHNFKIPSS